MVNDPVVKSCSKNHQTKIINPKLIINNSYNDKYLDSGAVQFTLIY